jgi:hypothetical protein
LWKRKTKRKTKALHFSSFSLLIHPLSISFSSHLLLLPPHLACHDPAARGTFFSASRSGNYLIIIIYSGLIIRFDPPASGRSSVDGNPFGRQPRSRLERNPGGFEMRGAANLFISRFARFAGGEARLPTMERVGHHGRRPLAARHGEGAYATTTVP